MGANEGVRVCGWLHDRRDVIEGARICAWLRSEIAWVPSARRRARLARDAWLESRLATCHALASAALDAVEAAPAASQVVVPVDVSPVLVHANACVLRCARQERVSTTSLAFAPSGDELASTHGDHSVCIFTVLLEGLGGVRLR